MKQITDPDGVTDFIQTDVDEDYEDSEDEKDDIVLSDADPQGAGSPDINPVSHMPSSRRMVTFAAMTGDNNEESKTQEWERMQKRLSEIAVKRLELFDKQEITASSVQTEIGSIFDKLQDRVQNRITESTIEYYRRKKLRKVRLLQDDESLRYLRLL